MESFKPDQTALPFPELSPPEEHPADRKFEHPDGRAILRHTILFLLTFATVSLAGVLWVGRSALADGYLDMLPDGILFAAVFLLFLGSHEFGHYFAAFHHRIKVTLPYFIPVPFGIGTLGAVIRIREKIDDSRVLFDIGIAGPIAGFVVSLATLLYGFATLPGPEFIAQFEGHDAIASYVQEHGVWPELPPAESGGMMMVLGNTLLYNFLASFFDHVPPMWEMYHYPFLFAGWLGLFFTALNLMPVGQLDGGHILYSLLGFRRHRTVARITYLGIITLAGIEAVPFLHASLSEWSPRMASITILLWAALLYFLMQRAYHRDHYWILPAWTLSLAVSLGWLWFSGKGLEQSGSMTWIIWAVFLTFFTGLEHPPTLYEQNLTKTRRVLGWMSMAIFVLCISPSPIYFLN